MLTKTDLKAIESLFDRKFDEKFKVALKPINRIKEACNKTITNNNGEPNYSTHKLCRFDFGLISCGEGEIRTREVLSDSYAFQAYALVHYATSPFLI